MDIPWGSEAARKFVTNVGLITTDGPKGPDVMAAEWTHHVSYSPGIIIVNINAGNKATAVNIEKSREFGVNIAAEDQNIASSISGSSSGADTDKIAVLKDLGFEFYRASKIKAPMIKGAALNVECKLIKSEKFGSHIMFVGEAVEVSVGGRPIAFHDGKYWHLDKQVEKPSQSIRDKIDKLTEKHRRK